VDNSHSRYEHGLEKCLIKASTACTPELKELWHTMADSYRCLLEYNTRTLAYHSWLRNNFYSSAERSAPDLLREDV
jgi:hypothetical protein